MIRLTVPSIEEDDLEAVRQSLASGFLVQGKHVGEFEQAVAGVAGAEHAVAVSNGTCALHLSLCALGAGPGDVCVVPAYSWIATANVVEHCGARPVFIDIDPRTFNIDTVALERALEALERDPATSGRTKAVIPVHAFGLMANMPEIMRICGRWGIPVVEDAACALGSSLGGLQSGSAGTLGCFSFHPRKAVTTGEGGMVTTNDADIAGRIRSLRNHGVDLDSPSPDFTSAGFNYRLTDFQGALGVSQMRKLDRIIASRTAAAAVYRDLLEASPLTAPYVNKEARHVYQSYVTLLPAEWSERRAWLISRARELGVELQIGTVHMPLTTFYRERYGFVEGSFPVTDSVAARALSLPLYEGITPELQKRVVEVVLGEMTS